MSFGKFGRSTFKILIPGIGVWSEIPADSSSFGTFGRSHLYISSRGKVQSRQQNEIKVWWNTCCANLAASVPADVEVVLRWNLVGRSRCAKPPRSSGTTPQVGRTCTASLLGVSKPQINVNGKAKNDLLRVQNVPILYLTPNPIIGLSCPSLFPAVETWLI